MAVLIGPARAGMVRPCCSPTGSTPNRPRTCGDGPCRDGTWPGRAASAPHARGWSGAAALALLHVVIGPARAGMVRGTDSAGRHHRDRPRTRGDGPCRTRRSPRCAPSAPHARGWSHHSRGPGDLAEIGPARAGMVPGCARRTRTAQNRPRTRGDGPVSIPSWTCRHLSARTRGDCPAVHHEPAGRPASAPHARGRSPTGTRQDPRIQSAPYARDGPATTSREATSPSRLRTRGDVPLFAPDLFGREPSAMPARGWPRWHGRGSHCRRVGPYVRGHA